MGGPSKVDTAGRVIAGLLGYNPGPGIYSRLERAIEAMPESVRVQELPGLLKRYKEGVPGWELKATDLDEVIAGRDVVPREELLARVKERSPVYTHKEVVLGGNPPTQSVWHYDITGPADEVVVPGHYSDVPVHQGEPSPLAGGVAHGMPRFETYGQGGEKYSELLLVDPANPARELPKPHHFDTDYPGDFLDASRETRRSASAGTVAHARYDTHGDALRINEIQSDINNYNIKAQKDRAPRQGRTESDEDYQRALQDAGWRFNLGDEGEIVGEPFRQQIPFAMEDTWSDMLIKRLALEAARQGHRAIEVVSPRAAAVSGGDLEHLQHLYGKVVPGALERLGRKMGGLVDDTRQPKTMQDFAEEAWARDPDGYAARQQFDRIMELEDDLNKRFPRNRPYGRRGIGETAAHIAMDAPWDPSITMDEATRLRDVLWGDLELAGHSFDDAERIANQRIGEVLHDVQRMKEMSHAQSRVRDRVERAAARRYEAAQSETAPPGRRYIMSDEMRRRLIEGGVGAAVGAGLMSDDDLIERLNQ